jgi:hypothetical protein
LIEFSDKILLVGKKTACFMKHFGIGLGHGAGRAVGSTKMMAEGLLKGFLKGGKAFFSDPAGCMKSIYKDVDAATDKLAQACAYVADNPDETWKRVKAFSSRAATRVGAMSAEEVAEASGAFVGEILTHCATGKVAGAAIGRAATLARDFATIARAEVAATASLVTKSPGFQKVLQPLTTACKNTRQIISIAAEHQLSKISSITELVFERLALEPIAVDAGAFLRANIASARELEHFLSSSAKVYGGRVTRGMKGLIRERQLPTKGKIRFVPSKKDILSRKISQSSLNGGRGFLDKFGNVWTRGESRSLRFGERFEWDVQLSSRGKAMLGWLSKSGKHLNVSLKGRVTH